MNELRYYRNGHGSYFIRKPGEFWVQVTDGRKGGIHKMVEKPDHGNDRIWESFTRVPHEVFISAINEAYSHQRQVIDRLANLFEYIQNQEAEYKQYIENMNRMQMHNDTKAKRPSFYVNADQC